jgi:D-alanyl-D-alanine dipeptidase
MHNRILYVMLIILIQLQSGCQLGGKSTDAGHESMDMDTLGTDQKVIPDTSKDSEHKTRVNHAVPDGFMEITEDTSGIILDIKYATTDNFTGKKIYDCGRCFMEKKAAEKIMAVNRDLNSRYGFGIKIFDCYRPSPFQQRLWDIVPNPDYVAPPHKGSVHSRGQAIDLTIIDRNGKELDMGTPFDFFGEEAHTDYTALKDEVLKNRRLLTKMMELHGYRGIRTEWWHFSTKEVTEPLHEWTWSCN